MKKSFTTEAINLKNYPLGDFDSIVVMFSKQKGLMRAVAKGVKKPKSKLGAQIQLFIANKLMLFEGKKLDTISQASAVNTFSKIRKDLDKLTYSMYVSEVINNFCSKEYNKDENYGEIYDLIFWTYEKIANAINKEEVLLSILKFQIKIMNILGWGLDFSRCAVCQCELFAESIFSPSYHGFVCHNCNDGYGGINVHSKIRAFLLELSELDYKTTSKYDELVNFAVLDKCFNFMKKYIDSLTNKKTKVLDVLEKLEAV